MDKKIHIYFMPGLAASSKIFENVRLPEDQFELHFLEWMIPKSNDETLENYSKRLSTKVLHPDPILIGVSFGGIVVQEMSKYVNPKKVIIISSIKNKSEQPKGFVFLQKSKFYKLFPTNRISKIKDFSFIGFNDSLKRKLKLYNKYLAVRDKIYLDWAIFNVLHWKTKDHSIHNLIHIHGSNDEVFPIKNIDNCIKIDGGTHAMIITKAKKISTILLEII